MEENFSLAMNHPQAYISFVTDELLKQKLSYLINNWEDEVVEFKGREPASKHEIADYVSALANEAFLKGKKEGWLVMGVDNKTRAVCGTRYKQEPESLHQFMLTLSQQTGGITHVNPHEIFCEERRVLMFQIPAALSGVPVPSGNIYYGRNGESLAVLPQPSIDCIRFKSRHFDWSGELCPAASIEDLDPDALKKAREQYKKARQADELLSQEIDSWSTENFLSNTGLMERRTLNNAALLLLGKSHARNLMGLRGTEIRWILRDSVDTLDYMHLAPPFILAADVAYGKIRNTNFRYMNDSDIFPETMLRYDEFTLREAINNAIAHCDYTKNASIDIVEFENEKVVITNKGAFLPQSLERVLDSESPFSEYRNDTLAHAMVTLQMIDRAGSGIRRMFRQQLNRLFPVPEYRIEQDGVQVSIMGKAIDISFAKNLRLENHDEITLWDISLLYSIYMGKEITKDAATRLRRKKLITGRFPHVQLSPMLVSRSTPDIRKHVINNQDLSDDVYKSLIISMMTDGEQRSRAEIVEMLERHFPRHLTALQKNWKISDILQKLRADGKMILEGRNKGARWSLPH